MVMGQPIVFWRASITV